MGRRKQCFEVCVRVRLRRGTKDGSLSERETADRLCCRACERACSAFTLEIVRLTRIAGENVGDEVTSLLTDLCILWDVIVARPDVVVDAIDVIRLERRLADE